MDPSERISARLALHDPWFIAHHCTAERVIDYGLVHESLSTFISYGVKKHHLFFYRKPSSSSASFTAIYHQNCTPKITMTILRRQRKYSTI